MAVHVDGKMKNKREEEKGMKIDFKDKKLVVIICLFIASIVFLIVVLLMNNARTVTCTLSSELLDGFTNKEKIVVKLGDGKIVNLKIDKTVSMNDFYVSYGTYSDSLKEVMRKGYPDVTEEDIEKKDESVRLRFSTNRGNIPLDALTIKYNTNDKTSLRFDVGRENVLRVTEEYSKKEIKNKLEDLGYTCR